MGKRYVFWRTPKGIPNKNSEQKESKILAEIGTTAEVDNSKISWKGFSIHRFETALKPVLVVRGPDKEELNETDSWLLIWAAILSVIKKCGGGRPISSKSFFSEADTKAAEYFRKPLEPYVLATTLSVESLPGKTLRINGSVVKFQDARGQRFPFPPRVNQQTLGRTFGYHIDKTKYKHVHVRTAGRSIHDATSRGLSDLTLLRGLWTLFGTYGAWSISFGIQRKLLGVIRTGPIHTLHYPNGKPVDDIYWYEPDFYDDDKLFKPSNGWSFIEKNRRSALRQINRYPIKKILRTSFVGTQ
jgi:hypothetical protein